MRFAGLSTVLVSLLVLSSCGGGQAPPAPRAPATAAASKPPAMRSAPPRPTFENPGGMWMPHQIAEHAGKLKDLGLAIDPAALSAPTSDVLSAVVSLGGCSASFVSPDGLVATNHHCATAALQHNSTAAKNLLEDGFLAKTREAEPNNGPQARIYVTRSASDVTKSITEGLEKIDGDQARYKQLEERQKKMVASCESELESIPGKGDGGAKATGPARKREGVRCSVVSFYEGAQWFLIEQTEIRDVRLVWAPPSGVGNYGGEIDNWRWPRHTGDVTLFRAYVGKDGKPADPSPQNVPYKPAHWLKVANAPLHEGDLVFVAGYPARTNTLKTKSEVTEALEWAYPRKQKLYEDYLARLERVTKDDKEAQIRAASYVRRFGNALTNTKGQIEGLSKGGLAAQKDKIDRDLRAFVAADPERQAKWGKVLDEIEEEVRKGAVFREADAELDEILLPKLVSAAATIVRMAEERAKPDADRDPEYQERNWSRHEQAFEGLATSYHRAVDEAVLGLALERALATPEKDRSAAVALVVGKESSPAGIARATSAIYGGTKLGDAAVRLALLKKATTADLKKNKDPLIQLALKLRPLGKAMEDRRERAGGKMAILKPRYIEVLKAFRKEPFAPDANSTLRITYGTVRGYRPQAAAPVHRPFTRLDEVVTKNQGKKPFDVPEPLLAAHKAKRFGPYVDATLGDVPVDFLADLHITGGNSGSATLNAKGELVGLVFDGNYESMASDWLFVPEITRSIHVDVRYVLWLLDAVFDGDHLLREMGVEPKIK